MKQTTKNLSFNQMVSEALFFEGEELNYQARLLGKRGLLYNEARKAMQLAQEFFDISDTLFYNEEKFNQEQIDRLFNKADRIKIVTKKYLKKTLTVGKKVTMI